MVEFNKTEKIFSELDQELTQRYITGRLAEVNKHAHSNRTRRTNEIHSTDLREYFEEAKDVYSTRRRLYET